MKRSRADTIGSGSWTQMTSDGVATGTVIAPGIKPACARSPASSSGSSTEKKAAVGTEIVGRIGRMSVAYHIRSNASKLAGVAA